MRARSDKATGPARQTQRDHRAAERNSPPRTPHPRRGIPSAQKAARSPRTPPGSRESFPDSYGKPHTEMPYLPREIVRGEFSGLHHGNLYAESFPYSIRQIVRGKPSPSRESAYKKFSGLLREAARGKPSPSREAPYKKFSGLLREAAREKPSPHGKPHAKPGPERPSCLHFFAPSPETQRKTRKSRDLCVRTVGSRPGPRVRVWGCPRSVVRNAVRRPGPCVGNGVEVVRGTVACNCRKSPALCACEMPYVARVRVRGCGGVRARSRKA